MNGVQCLSAPGIKREAAPTMWDPDWPESGCKSSRPSLEKKEKTERSRLSGCYGTNKKGATRQGGGLKKDSCSVTDGGKKKGKKGESVGAGKGK